MNSHKNRTISILLPSRNRPKSLERLFSSISATSASLKLIEVLVYLDLDDFVTDETKFRNFNFVKFFRGPRVWMSLAQNFLFMQSRGDILMAASDDFIFKTKHWDEKVREVFEESLNKPLLLFGNDLGKHAGKLSTHFFLNRVWPSKLGYWVPVNRNGVWDLWIYELATKLNCVIYREDLIFEHAHFRHSQKSKFLNRPDSLSLEIMQSQELVKPLRTYRLLGRERTLDLLFMTQPLENLPRSKFNFILSRLFLFLIGNKLSSFGRQKILVRNNFEIFLDIFEFVRFKIGKFTEYLRALDDI